MSILKIAIIGGTGLLGSNLVRLYSKNDVRSFSRSHLNNVAHAKNNVINFGDLSNELSKYFDVWKPNIIINTVAIVDLQKCESDFDMAEFGSAAHAMLRGTSLLVPHEALARAKKELDDAGWGVALDADGEDSDPSEGSSGI